MTNAALVERLREALAIVTAMCQSAAVWPEDDVQGLRYHALESAKLGKFALTLTAADPAPQTPELERIELLARLIEEDPLSVGADVRARASQIRKLVAPRSATGERTLLPDEPRSLRSTDDDAIRGLASRLQRDVHERALGASPLFSTAHWQHNAGPDWPEQPDDDSYIAFENCAHPDCRLVRSLRSGVEPPRKCPVCGLRSAPGTVYCACGAMTAFDRSGVGGASERPPDAIREWLEQEIAQQEEYARLGPSDAWPRMTPEHHRHVATILKLMLMRATVDPPQVTGDARASSTDAPQRCSAHGKIGCGQCWLDALQTGTPGAQDEGRRKP